MNNKQISIALITLAIIAIIAVLAVALINNNNAAPVQDSTISSQQNQKDASRAAVLDQGQNLNNEETKDDKEISDIENDLDSVSDDNFGDESLSDAEAGL